MMKNFLLLFVFLLISCVSQTKTNYIKSKDVKIQCSLQNQNEIYISFLNQENFTIDINKPCMFNAYIDIQKNGKSLISKMRVKSSPECMYPIHPLGKNDSVKFKYNYKLNDLFDLEAGEEYKMFVEYYVYENNELKQKIISPDYDFVWGK